MSSSCHGTAGYTKPQRSYNYYLFAATNAFHQPGTVYSLAYGRRSSCGRNESGWRHWSSFWRISDGSPMHTDWCKIVISDNPRLQQQPATSCYSRGIVQLKMMCENRHALSGCRFRIQTFLQATVSTLPSERCLRVPVAVARANAISPATSTSEGDFPPTEA